MIWEPAFVIMAAGQGTRLGRTGSHLHKCLVPLQGQAIISHQLAARPLDSQVIVCVGYRAEQIREYLELAHPDLDVTFVYVEDWDAPGAGPGASLLQARDAVGDRDMVFTSCDTLWSGVDWSVMADTTWAGTAPVPPGTSPARWCRLEVDSEGYVLGVIDKAPGTVAERFHQALAYVGLAGVALPDLAMFWEGIETGPLADHERQVSGGLAAVAANDVLYALPVDWIDVGDEEAYRQAVALRSGYDWTKTDQATYVLPQTGRVVKYHDDQQVIQRRRDRGRQLAARGVAPHVMLSRRETPTMIGIPYVPGTSVYDVASKEVVTKLVSWMDGQLHRPKVPDDVRDTSVHGTSFYVDKTLARIDQLVPHLREIARDLVDSVHWHPITHDVRPGVWHGDLNFGNVIVAEDDSFWAIDWREDFAGETAWGDMRYDVAKLLAGCVVHWDNARRGDFRPWADGPQYADIIRESLNYDPTCEIIGALSLLNSAPLHASPLDEVLVARAIAWLMEAL